MRGDPQRIAAGAVEQLDPAWAKLIDFETTLPVAVEELIRRRDEPQPA